MTTTHDGRRFDWAPRHDPRSRSFAIRTEITRPARKTKRWTPGGILDQGFEGACVGFAWTGEAVATPVRVDLAAAATELPDEPHEFARAVYRNAQRIDEWEGEQYEGTSVLAGAKIMQGARFLPEYRWAFGIEDVIDALILRGPVVLGTWWYDGMFEPAEGVEVLPIGEQVGGHAYLATGYLHTGSIWAGRVAHEPMIILQNSWGLGWGWNGQAVITAANLGALLRDDGEACVPWRRSYGRVAL